jgi:hypothetical protein
VRKIGKDVRKSGGGETETVKRRGGRERLIITWLYAARATLLPFPQRTFARSFIFVCFLPSSLLCFLALSVERGAALSLVYFHCLLSLTFTYLHTYNHICVYIYSRVALDSSIEVSVSFLLYYTDSYLFILLHFF